MARKAGLRHALGHTKLPEEGLDPGVERLARTFSRGSFAVEDHRQTSVGARDRGGGAGGTRSDYGDVGL